MIADGRSIWFTIPYAFLQHFCAKNITTSSCTSIFYDIKLDEWMYFMDCSPFNNFRKTENMMRQIQYTPLCTKTNYKLKYIFKKLLNNIGLICTHFFPVASSEDSELQSQFYSNSFQRGSLNKIMDSILGPQFGNKWRLALASSPNKGMM